MGSPNLVIVEKDRIVALDLEFQVRKFGYNPIAVYSSAEELIKNITKIDPEIVLMDLDLKGKINGLNAAGMIREEHNIPVVLITAFLDDLSAEEKRGLLPFGYLVKPIVSRELRLSLDMAIYRHQMELKLKASEDEYKKFFEDDLSANFIADREGVVITCNSAFSEMLDFTTPLEAAGVSLSKIFSDTQEGKSFVSEVANKNQMLLTERSMRTRSGRTIHVVGNFMGQFDPSGELVGIIGYLQDNTEQRQLEEMFRQSQKLEAVGRLSGGIAHDFNNVLTIIQGYTVMLKEKSEDGEDIALEISGIQSAAKKAANLTRQLLNFSRRQDLKPEYFEVNSLISELENMVRRLIGEEIVIRFYTGAENSMIFADPGMLEQVLINLAVNSRDAMPGGGNLVIGTANREMDGAEPSIMGQIPAGEYIEIYVTDTGTGIEPEVQEKIFEPFFTTKPEYKGTGLGLSSAYGIIRQSGGYIKLESETNKGTVFRIFLPLRIGDIRENSVPHIPAGDLSGDETILVVEDDADIRGILIKTLAQAGYRPLGVENAGEALLICEREPDIKLVITDFLMPYLNGVQLMLRLGREYPKMLFIMISGFSESVIREREPDTPEISFIPKPLVPEDVLMRMRALLDG
ncbi:MAG: response regulator [Spirochaetales bacterium]|nr:response regulator [Spirochaetales bacterium]